ncbi:MAG: hypothetical protein PF508_03505 [Spirochaeta sp.]|jgi:hypothetical protein|nr:hypothetical protein [Spirochaeta sp.]
MRNTLIDKEALRQAGKLKCCVRFDDDDEIIKTVFQEELDDIGHPHLPFKDLEEFVLQRYGQDTVSDWQCGAADDSELRQIAVKLWASYRINKLPIVPGRLEQIAQEMGRL